MTKLAPLFCVALLFACSSKKEAPKSKTDDPANTTDDTKDPGVTAKVKDAPSKTEMSAEKARKNATALLEDWRKAQVDGTFPAYKRHYHPKYFRGVKRTSSGKVKRMDYKGWLKDRGRMFQKKVEVVTEDVEVETWLDPKSKLKAGVIRLRFLQRWKSGNYADHGIKVVQLWQDPKGKQRIVYEDLINAEKGWDDTAENVDKIEVATPKSQTEALELWATLKVTGANYSTVLASIPDDEATRIGLARALINTGNFACDKFDSWDECGEEISEWMPLEEKATFEDPCLRRRLAMWALDELPEGELDKIKDKLVEMVSINGPTDELTNSVLMAVTDDGVGRETTVAVVSAAAKTGKTEAAEGAVEEVSDRKTLEELYGSGFSAAGTKLVEQLKAKDVDLLAKIAGDASLADEPRDTALAELAANEGASTTEALKKLAIIGHCSISMGAAEALAERGDKSFLPTHKGATKSSAHLDLCRLAAGESQYSSDEFEKFFDEEGVAFTEITEGDHYVEYDDDGNPIEEEEEEEVEDEPQMLSSQDFIDLDPFDDDEVSFDFRTDAKKGVVVNSAERVTWTGCGC